MVIALKSTVYRTGDDTPLVPALIEASENGKQSVCLVEIKARGNLISHTPALGDGTRLHKHRPSDR